jgi:large subunit ribosomal protein L21
MYAIVDAMGQQIKVSKGDEVCVQKIKGDINSEVVFDKVLLLSKDDRIILGKPYIEGAKVTAEIIETKKGDKILVYGPRPKKARRRLRGHRQYYSLLKIKEIIGG